MLLSSPSLALPELMPATAVAPSGSESLVELVEADHQQWPTLQASPHSTPTLQLAPQDWRLELEGIGWFRATGGERLEWQRWDDSVSDRDIRTFAVTSGLGALAIQRGALVLHGTALERDGEAILLLGHPAAGKSTLAWCLLQEGWRLLSSELVVVGSDGMVQPGIQQLKFWHDAAAVIAVISKVGIEQHISEEHTVLANRERQEPAHTGLVWCTRSLQCSLETPVEFDCILEVDLHHPEIFCTTSVLSSSRQQGRVREC